MHNTSGLYEPRISFYDNVIDMPTCHAPRGAKSAALAVCTNICRASTHLALQLSDPRAHLRVLSLHRSQPRLRKHQVLAGSRCCSTATFCRLRSRSARGSGRLRSEGRRLTAPCWQLIHATWLYWSLAVLAAGCVRGSCCKGVVYRGALRAGHRA